MHNILFIKGLYPAHFKYEILQEHRHALIIFPIYSFKVSSLTFIKHVKNLFDPKKQYFEMFLMVRAFLPLIILQASWEKCYLMHNVYLKFRKIMTLIHYSWKFRTRFIQQLYLQWKVIIFYRISWQVIITWKNFQISVLQNLYPVKTLDLSTKYFVVFW